LAQIVLIDSCIGVCQRRSFAAMDSQQRNCEENLVHFPRVAGSGERFIDDPLEELLNEFAHLDDLTTDELPEQCVLAEQFQKYQDKDFASLSPTEALVVAREQLELLNEIRARVKYLIKEIETYLVPID